MAKDKPIALDQLRARASDDARAILDRIWDYYCEQRAGMPAMELWPRFHGKGSVREALTPLGQTVVRLDWENGKECYRVPLLGVLVSNRGLEAEGLLLRYLEYVRERYYKGEVGPITSEQLEKERGFSFEQSRFLSKLLNGSVFSGAASVPNNIAEPWCVEMPTVIADAPPSGDLRGFFCDQAMRTFTPDLPVDAREWVVEVTQSDNPDNQLFWKQPSTAPDHLAAFKSLDLHPAIRGASARLYEDRHYRNAVFDASLKLEELVQEKSGRHDLNGAGLMTKVFSPNDPIVAFNDLQDRTDRDEQEGMMHLFLGIVLALRNPRAHALSDDLPDQALECLALLSFLAKRLDQAKRVK